MNIPMFWVRLTEMNGAPVAINLARVETIDPGISDTGARLCFDGASHVVLVKEGMNEILYMVPSGYRGS